MLREKSSKADKGGSSNFSSKITKKKALAKSYTESKDIQKSLDQKIKQAEKKGVKVEQLLVLKELYLYQREYQNISGNKQSFSVNGGAGSAVGEFVLDNKLPVFVKNIGLPDEFLPHGTREEILALAGLSEAGIEKTVREFVR